MIDGVTLDLSALVLPVLEPDACVVATRVQFVVAGHGVLLAGEHFALDGPLGPHSGRHLAAHQFPNIGEVADEGRQRPR